MFRLQILTHHHLSLPFRDNTVDELQKLKVDEPCPNPKKPSADPKPGNKGKGGKVALKCPKGMRDYTPDQVMVV